MDIDILNQELLEKMSSLQNEMCSLQNELDNCKRQQEVISIIKRLKSVGNLKPGYTNIMSTKMENLSISSDGFATFISLLNSNEYLKGYNSGGNILGAHPSECKYYNYYLTLGPGIILELVFCETEIKGYDNPIKEYDLSIRSYMNVDFQDLYIKVDAKNGWLKIEILEQGGDWVFRANATDESLASNGRKLNEALIPISPDDLANRFFDILQKHEVIQK